jgi:glycosyltransferase involved in cell wall biosynthesis
VPRLLYLLPYSLDNQIHGGKVRSNWISKKLGEIGKSLEVVFVNDRSFVPEEKPSFSNLVPKELAGDLDFLTRNYSLELLVDSETELVVFEQPWLWHEIERIKIKYPNIKTVYSSQNVEWELKRKIFERYLGNLDFEPIIGFIRDLEIRIAKNVNAIIAVSAEDARWYEKYSKNKVTLARNGTSFIPEETIFTKVIQPNYGLVVGSAHPPNIEGAITYLSDPDVWLPRGAVLKIVGSLSTALKPFWSGLVNRWGESCVELIDSMQDAELNHAVAKAKVILLPITYGGGTNLKTAEALASNCYVVGSSSAFRGFEEYSSMDGIFQVKNSMEFKIRTVGSLNQTVTPVNRRLLPELHWNTSLEPMKLRISGLLDA